MLSSWTKALLLNLILGWVWFKVLRMFLLKMGSPKDVSDFLFRPSAFSDFLAFYITGSSMASMTASLFYFVSFTSFALSICFWTFPGLSSTLLLAPFLSRTLLLFVSLLWAIEMLSSTSRTEFLFWRLWFVYLKTVTWFIRSCTVFSD